MATVAFKFKVGDKVRIKPDDKGIWDNFTTERGIGDPHSKEFTITECKSIGVLNSPYYKVQEYSQDWSCEGYLTETWFDLVEPAKSNTVHDTALKINRLAAPLEKVKGHKNIPVGRIAKLEDGLYFARTGTISYIKIWTGENDRIGGPTIEGEDYSSNTWEDFEFELLPLDTTITLCFNGDKWEGAKDV